MNAHVTALCMATAMGWLMTFCAADSSLGQVKAENGLVAVLDVAKVFKEDKSFRNQIDQLRNEVEKRKVELAQGKGDSPKELRDDLLKMEAAIYSEMYDRVQDVVASIAEEHDIALVIRANTQPELGNDSREFDAAASKDSDMPSYKEVVKRLNNMVVYQKHLDLTTMVIAELEKTSGNESGERCESCGQSLHHPRR